MPLNDEETQQLLALAAEGDKSATQRLLCENRDRLRAMVRSRMDRRLRARVDPSDVVQDALLKASEKLSTFAQHQPIEFYPWLRQIARDRLIDLHRRHVVAEKRSVNREAGRDVELNDDSIEMLDRGNVGSNKRSPDSKAIQNERKQQMRRAIGLIDPVTREVVLLHYVGQMKLREIAETLGLSESAVKSRHIRGLKKLAKLFNKDEHTE